MRKTNDENNWTSANEPIQVQDDVNTKNHDYTRKIKRTSRLILLTIPISIFAIFVSLVGILKPTPKTPSLDYQTIMDAPGKQVAINAIGDWIKANNLSYTIISFDGSEKTPYPLNDKENREGVIETGEAVYTHAFTLTDTNQKNNYTCKVKTVSSSLYGTVAQKDISIVPQKSNGQRNSPLSLWASLSNSASVPTNIRENVEVFAKLYYTSNTKELTAFMNDVKDHYYVPFSIDPSLDKAKFINDFKVKINSFAKVKQESKDPNSPNIKAYLNFTVNNIYSLDLLILDPDGVPKIVAWSNTGTADTLTPYQNALNASRVDNVK
jgi:hypothetical protein